MLRLDSIVKGFNEIREKLGYLKDQTNGFNQTGYLPDFDHWYQPQSMYNLNGASYDWTSNVWELGYRLSPREGVGPHRVNPQEFGGPPVNAFWIMQVTSGLILYISERDLERLSAETAPLAVRAANHLLKRYRAAQKAQGGSVLPEPNIPDTGPALPLPPLPSYAYEIPGYLWQDFFPDYEWSPPSTGIDSNALALLALAGIGLCALLLPTPEELFLFPALDRLLRGGS